jgi:hypothetical protein
VCSWIGNSQAVAKKHYLQVTDQHYEQATRPLDDAQNDAQCSDFEEVEGHSTEWNDDNPREIAGCRELCSESMGGRGLEPLTSTV